MNAGKTKKQGKDKDVKEENEETDAQKDTTKYDDLTELRNRVNRKLEMLKENLMWGLRMAGMRWMEWDKGWNEVNGWNEMNGMR